MIILGVDPGSLRTGYGVIDTNGRRHQLVESGVIAPRASSALPERLRFIHDGIRALIERLRPEAMAVEDVFHAVNSRTALVLGHVRGVVLLAGAQSSVPVCTLPPATVKHQVTGSGAAAKAQVAFMVAQLLELPGGGRPGDASDALAVALCQAQLLGVPAIIRPAAAVRAGRRA